MKGKILSTAVAVFRDERVKELLHLGRGRNCGETFDCKMKACQGSLKSRTFVVRGCPFTSQNNILFTLLLFVYYLFLELHLRFSLLVSWMQQCKGDNLP